MHDVGREGSIRSRPIQRAVDLLHQILSVAHTIIRSPPSVWDHLHRRSVTTTLKSHLDRRSPEAGAGEPRSPELDGDYGKISGEVRRGDCARPASPVQLEPDSPLVQHPRGLHNTSPSERPRTRSPRLKRRSSSIRPTRPSIRISGMLFRIDEVAGLEALEAFQKALDLDPSVMGNWLEVCQQLQWLSRWTDAIEVAQRGVRAIFGYDQRVYDRAREHACLDPDRPTGRGRADVRTRPCSSTHPRARRTPSGWWRRAVSRKSLNCLAQSVRIKPMQDYAYFCLSESKRFEVDGEPWLEKAEAAYDSPNLRIRDRVFLDTRSRRRHWTRKATTERRWPASTRLAILRFECTMRAVLSTTK